MQTILLTTLFLILVVGVPITVSLRERRKAHIRACALYFNITCGEIEFRIPESEFTPLEYAVHAQMKAAAPGDRHDLLMYLARQHYRSVEREKLEQFLEAAWNIRD